MRKKRGFELFESTAEMGVRGFGSTLAEAFENGAKAMFSIMVDLENVDTSVEKKISVEAHDEETLFCEWLNELLALRDIEGLFFSEFRVEKLEGSESQWILEGYALGEPIDASKHAIETEVKAATYFQLETGKINDAYYAQCIVDV
ncbi:MAG: archease [Candidatus Geothermarchaeales archaeon]